MDDDLSINLSASGNFPLHKKKNRFWGNKNYRNTSRYRYVGQNAKPTILNTSKVKILDSEDKSVLKQGKNENDDYSTALHFKGVEVLPNEKPKKVKYFAKRSNTKGKTVVSLNTDESKSSTDKQKTNLNEITKKTSVTAHRKSSLFNQNPQIPKVSQPDISSVQEDIFSRENFSDLEIHPHLLSYINHNLKLKNMTSIQQKAIPVLLSGRDALVKSQTGSGKTLAYAIPVIHRIQEIKPNIKRKDGPIAMVLVPTRELALQSYDVFSKLTLPFCRIVATWIIGGENRKSEKSRIRKGINIIIGTPGRILDHIQTTEALSLANLRWLIFDEADRLLDMGFQKQVDAIRNAVKNQSTKKCQNVLLSATLSDKVQRLVDLALHNPCHVQVTNTDVDSGIEKEDDEIFALPEKLIQHVCIIPSKLRLVALATFLKAKQLRNKPVKVIVFLSCRDSVEFHYHLLKHVLRKPKLDNGMEIPLDIDLADSEVEHVNIVQLHGGLSQNERQEVFHSFSISDTGILLTTDVAARGLDLPSVHWVIQYTSPGSPVDYIHRAGRTARAGNKGNALLMLTPSEVKYVNLLTQFNIQVEEMNVDDILIMGINATGVNKKNADFKLRLLDAAKSEATNLQSQMESYVSKSIKIKTLARTAYMSFIRAYATYPTELKSIFHVKYLHLGHVAKSFGLQDAPHDIVKNLQKSVGQLPVKTSFEYREAKIELTKVEKEQPSDSEDQKKEIIQVTKELTKPRLSRKQIMKNKMSRKPDLMSEFSSGLSSSDIPAKKMKKR
uniref:probable ATP-dependent RNA helicase DDX31 n=1 Tax=Styela clava TaxID=7725 RepID=UPI0019396A6A|nr:probable ATP-dependent RNA helicase DDX31 [Styela clava]